MTNESGTFNGTHCFRHHFWKGLLRVAFCVRNRQTRGQRVPRNYEHVSICDIFVGAAVVLKWLVWCWPVAVWASGSVCSWAAWGVIVSWPFSLLARSLMKLVQDFCSWSELQRQEWITKNWDYFSFSLSFWYLFPSSIQGIRILTHGVPAVVPWDWQHLGSAVMQVRSPALQCVKDPALMHLWLRLQLQLRSDAWPGNSVCCRAAKKERKKKEFWLMFYHSSVLEYYLCV